MITVDQYNAIKKERAQAVKLNASYRMSGQKHMQVPLPELPPKPKKWVLEDQEGNYEGTFWDKAEAEDCAEYNGFKIFEMDFDKFI